MSTAPWTMNKDVDVVVAAVAAVICRHCRNTRNDGTPTLCTECARCIDDAGTCQDSPSCTIRDTAYVGDENRLGITPLPHVVSTSPAAGAVGVADDATITVTFSRAMDSGTIITANVYLTDGAGAPQGPSQSGNPTLDGGTAKIATFQLSGTLTKDADYKIRVTVAATDKAGNALLEQYNSATAWHTAA